MPETWETSISDQTDDFTTEEQKSTNATQLFLFLTTDKLIVRQMKEISDSLPASELERHWFN